jgi:DNA-directed RNA polymerase subunit RPC12/RpoP
MSKRSAAVRIELNCAACGNNHFSLDQEMDDDAHVRCRDCGHYIGTLAQLKERVAAEVMKRSGMSAPSEGALSEQHRAGFAVGASFCLVRNRSSQRFSSSPLRARCSRPSGWTNVRFGWKA